MTTAREIKMPPPDLLEDLIVRPDPSIGDPLGQRPRRCLPRHERLYVAAWMLHDGTAADYKRALREAYDMYELSGSGLLDKARELTTADIVTEVFWLLEGRAQ